MIGYKSLQCLIASKKTAAESGDQLVLKSPHGWSGDLSVWRGRRLVAICNRNDFRPSGEPWYERNHPHKPSHTPPGEDCTCGIYVTYDFGAAENYFSFDHPSLLVLVEGLGKLVLHETGFRAEIAEIVGIVGYEVPFMITEGYIRLELPIYTIEESEAIIRQAVAQLP
jgi:hypothetical protein